MDANFYSQFWPGLAATIIGGIFLTTGFFILRERLFGMPTLAGVWECEQTTLETAYNPFKGMKVWYRIVILQEREKLTGTGEKDREKSQKVDKTFEGQARIAVQVSGRIEKFYTKSDVINIHWSEDGTNRKSSTFHTLNISGSKHSGKLYGKFFSTAGQCRGVVTWSRIS